MSRVGGPRYRGREAAKPLEECTTRENGNKGKNQYRRDLEFSASFASRTTGRLPTGVFFRRMPLVGKRPMFSFAPEHGWGKPLVEPARSFDQLEKASVEES